MKKRLIQTASLAFIFVFWLILYEIIQNPLLMPSVTDVMKSFFDLFKSSSDLYAIGLTFIRLIISISFGACLGILIGFMSAKLESISTFFSPYMTLFKSIPVISLIVIMYIIVGYEMAAYVIVILMVMPLFYHATYEGMSNIDQSFLDVYHLDSDHMLLGIKYVYYPFIKSHLILAFYQSFGLGFKVLVTAEFITQTKNSVGQLLYHAKINLAYDKVFAISILMIIVTIAFERLLKYYKTKQ